ncbi:MAG: replication protein P [Janthinobacterium lividum]
MNEISSSTCSHNPWLSGHPKVGIAWIDHLYNRLDGAYPNRWRAAFSGPTAIENWRETWSEAFVEEGLTPNMVGAGLKACRRMYDWPPSLTEFIKACQPPINVDAAIYEAIAQMRARQTGKDMWSDPAIFWAAMKVGEWDMVSSSFAQLRPRFEAALKAVLAQGEVLPVPPRVEAIAAPGKSESTREFARERLAELGASEIIKPAGVGNVRWAHLIVDAHAAGGKVPLHKLEIARTAIRNVAGDRP